MSFVRNLYCRVSPLRFVCLPSGVSGEGTPEGSDTIHMRFTVRHSGAVLCLSRLSWLLSIRKESPIHDKSPVFTGSLPYFCSQILELKLLLLVSYCLAVASVLELAELSSNMARS